MSEGRVTRVGKVLWLVLIRGVNIVVEVIKMVLSYGSIGSLGDIPPCFENRLSKLFSGSEQHRKKK